MKNNPWFLWILLNEEGKVIIEDSCREGMMSYAFDDLYNDRLFVQSNNINEHTEEAKAYIEKWNKHFKQNVGIETTSINKYGCAKIVNSKIFILYLIFYSVLRGDRKDYTDGGLLDYCIENNIKTKELEDYEIYLIRDIFPMDWDDDNWMEINGPIDYFDHFKHSWRKK